MATFLSSALALATLLQAPAAQTPATGTAADSLVALREHLARDSTDGHAWLLLRSEEHTSELQSQSNLVCRLLLEKKTTIRIRRQDQRRDRSQAEQMLQDRRAVIQPHHAANEIAVKDDMAPASGAPLDLPTR